MDGSPVSVNVAVVGIGVDEAPVKTVIERLETAGHRVLGKKQIAAGAPLLDVLAGCIEDAEIDIVLLVAHDTDPVRDAMAPLVTKALPGFGELLRAAAFSEIGSAAMLLDGEAARCGTTYVFVLPGTVGAVKVAMEQLLLPQLDLRTRPTNLASKLPRLRGVPPPADAFAEREITDVGTPPPPTKTPSQPPVNAPRASKTMPPPMPKPVSKPVTKTPPMGVVLRATPVEPAAATDAELITSDAAILIPPAEIAPEAAPAAAAPAPAPEPEKHTDTIAAEQLGAFVMSLEHHAQKLRAEKSQVGPLPAPPSQTQPPPSTLRPPSKSKTQPPPIKRKTDAEMKADRDASVAEAISKVEPLPAKSAEPAPPAKDAEAAPRSREQTAPPPTPKRKKNETTPQQWAKAADAMEKISPRAATGNTGSLGAPSTVLAQGDRVIVIPQHKPRRAWLWVPLALAIGVGGAFGVKALFLSGNRTASAEPQPEQTVRVESVEALPSPAEPAPGSPATGSAATGSAAIGSAAVAIAPTPELAPAPEIEMEPAGTGDGNLTALAQGHGHHAGGPAPAVRSGSADSVAAPTGPAATGSAAGSDEVADPRTHPNIAPASPDCDEASCILERYQRECCARYKPAEPPAEAAKPSGPPETLDKAAVIAGIADLKPAVQQCGEEHYAKGTVKITLTVNADGRVTAATVADSPDPTLGQCVAKVLERASFGKTQNGAVFTYPFLF